MIVGGLSSNPKKSRYLESYLYNLLNTKQFYVFNDCFNEEKAINPRNNDFISLVIQLSMIVIRFE